MGADRLRLVLKRSLAHWMCKAPTVPGYLRRQGVQNVLNFLLSLGRAKSPGYCDSETLPPEVSPILTEHCVKHPLW